MNLEQLKIRTEKLRAQYVGRGYVQWPKDFKKEIVKALNAEIPIKKCPRNLKFKSQVYVDGKRFMEKKHSKNFKSFSVVEDKKENSIQLSWKADLTVKALSFSEFKELLKEGLLS